MLPSQQFKESHFLQSSLTEKKGENKYRRTCRKPGTGQKSQGVYFIPAHARCFDGSCIISLIQRQKPRPLLIAELTVSKRPDKDDHRNRDAQPHVCNKIRKIHSPSPYSYSYS